MMPSRRAPSGPGRRGVPPMPRAAVPSKAAAAERLRTCRLHDLSDKLLPYEQVWSMQKRIVEAKTARPSADLGHDLILCQHEPVYTLGAGSTLENLKFDPDDPPLPLYRTERGGEVTYHGPGQLVLYPILNLRAFRADLHWYMRQLEQVAVETIGRYGVRGERREGLTGVWVDGAKVAALGVRAKRWVTYHGLALNVTADLEPFARIVPCGIQGAPVASLEHILRERGRAEHGEGGALEGGELLASAAEDLLESFAEVFGVRLVE